MISCFLKKDIKNEFLTFYYDISSLLFKRIEKITSKFNIPKTRHETISTMLRVLSNVRLVGRRSVSGHHWNAKLNLEIRNNKNFLVTSQQRWKSSSSSSNDDELERLKYIRNVGVLAHVDAGKTTVTERMLALAGIVHSAGNVDDGNTVTDYLPAERERGITIQSAAISFPWKWHSSTNTEGDDDVTIHLIDTPGHVDFSVEVNRSVAVLDGAVLVVDAVAGVQAQTETVWRAMTQPSNNNHINETNKTNTHEPLPCLAFVNKMDKEGCSFAHVIQTIQYKLAGANPIPIQIPLFQTGSSHKITSNDHLPSNIIAVSPNDTAVTNINGHFVGVVDILHMRAVIWPDTNLTSNVEACAPTVINLNTNEQQSCQVTTVAMEARQDLIASLANFDENMEEYFLMEEEPSNDDMIAALRRTTLKRQILPVMAGAALRGKGVEPLLDAVADLLPSPLDRLPPALIPIEQPSQYQRKHKKKKQKQQNKDKDESTMKTPFGHPLHPSLLALAFKVVHMKGRGGSGDGRVVFARVYSGAIHTRDTLKVYSPGELMRTERVGGMLELAGGRFNNLEDGACYSGDVCALIGLKSVVTGDTLFLASEGKNNKKQKQNCVKDVGNVYLAGVTSPKPVLTVRLEAETSDQQNKLSNALQLLSVEDPSLQIEETDSATLLSGLGELHIEIVLDRLRREYGLNVWAGKPSVAYRETVTQNFETSGLINYDSTIGSTRLQAAIHLEFQPAQTNITAIDSSSCVTLSEPIVTIGPNVREFLEVDDESTEDELFETNEVVKALIAGCQGALKRGPIGTYAMANMTCHVVNIDADGGLAYLKSMPGALRAASSYAISSALVENQPSCVVLEPSMSMEINVPGDMVGSVLSDITSRRGTVGDVVIADNNDNSAFQSKALIRGEVPLVEILGYASSLRSLTAGEGNFSAEYKGHSPHDDH